MVLVWHYASKIGQPRTGTNPPLALMVWSTWERRRPKISRDDSGVAAIEAPLQVRGGASGRSASSLERGWQAVTDANATAKCSLPGVATPRHPNSTPCRVVALLLRVEASDVYIVPPSPRYASRGAVSV